MVFGGLKIDENVVGAYLFDGFWWFGGLTFWVFENSLFLSRAFVGFAALTLELWHRQHATAQKHLQKS